MRLFLTKQRIVALSTVLFLIGLAIIAILDAWWPGIMLAIGLPLAFRQYLFGKTYDMGITLLVFVGTFVTVEYDISWRIFLPILFSIGAIYILIKEFIKPEKDDEEEK